MNILLIAPISGATIVVSYNPYMPKGQKLQVNPDQKKAIEHSKGPLLVVAGAGTGKTRVITERMRFLLEKKDVSANEILALTFTEKAAAEMSDRVSDVMPLGYEEPWISTFHSFADRILKAEGLEIGLDPSYKVLSGPAQWLLLRKNLFNLELEYFLPMGNPTKFISAILKFISRLQDEYISVEDLQAYAQNFAGEENEKKRWLELAKIYEIYQNIKIEKSRLDFGDLINWCIRLFDERPNILKKYQEQFKHVLLDEFQDTNYAQYMLVKMLSPQQMGTRTLLAVGDDSQSIYKFRGAAVSNILEFMKDYPEAEMVTLTKNYRSTQKILDPSYTLVQNNNPDTLESKLNISKQLTSELDEDGPQPEILLTDTLEDEVELTISKIYEVLAREPTYTYKDIAILARANSHLDPLILAMRKHGLPYQLVGNRGLYDQDEVRNIMAMLRVIINPRDSINLYRVLNIDAFEIPQQLITKLLANSKYAKKEIWEMIEEHKSPQISSLYQLIIKYQDQITKATPVEFVYELVNESGYLAQFLQEDTIENKLYIKNLDLFLNIVKKFEVDYRSDNRELPTVVDLVDHIDLLAQAGDNPAQAEVEDVDTVNLLTVHAAKGLEFPVVFMINLVAGRFPTRNRKDVIEIPDELIKETLPTGNEHIQEERRLFYVGMTRAKKYLYMMLAKNYGGVRDRKPTGYLEETELKMTPVETSDIGADKNDQKALFGVESGFRDPIYAPTDFTPKFFSYSQMDTYKICPTRYKYRYILNVPTPPSHNLSFGITIHDTLRDYHSIKMSKKVDLPELLKIYENNWQPLGFMDEQHRQHRFEDGKKLLESYYQKHNNEQTKPIALEKSFNLRFGATKFFGRIDRIDPFEDGVEIIDYKTGSTKSQKDVDKDDQVAFYALAAKDALGMNPKKLTYYFLESGEQISTTRTPEHLQEKKESVQPIIDKISGGEFEAKPGMHCNWCDFKSVCPFAYKG